MKRNLTIRVDDDMYDALMSGARCAETTVSELVRGMVAYVLLSARAACGNDRNCLRAFLKRIAQMGR